MKAQVSNEQIYELALEIRRQLDELLVSFDEVGQMLKSMNAEFAARRYLPLVESPPTSEASP